MWIFPTKGGRRPGRAGAALKEGGYHFDVAFTSVLKRAIRTLWSVLDEMDQMWIPVHRSWRLERAPLRRAARPEQSRNGRQVRRRQVKIWRRSYDVPPPALTPDDQRIPAATPATRV